MLTTVTNIHPVDLGRSLLSHFLNWQVSAANKVGRAGRFPMCPTVGLLSVEYRMLFTYHMDPVTFPETLSLSKPLVAISFSETCIFYCLGGPSVHFSQLQTHGIFQKHSYKSCLGKENNSSLLFLPIQQKTRVKMFFCNFLCNPVVYVWCVLVSLFR